MRTIDRRFMGRRIAPLLALVALASSPSWAGQSGVELRGSAIFEGTRPAQKPVRLLGDPKCIEMHMVDGKLTPPLREDLIVDEKLGIQNVFIYIKEIEGEFKAPEKAAVLDQKMCAYTPHVLGVMTGQKLEVRNSDMTLHNVHGASKKNKGFNKSQFQGAPPIVIEYGEAEIGVKLTCDVHPWMKAFVHVMDHPFFAVTKADGSFTIEDLPPGDYTLVAWHEKLGAQEREITVGAGAAAKIEFKLKPRR